MDPESARELLHGHDLRATPARIALLCVLAERAAPIAHGEAVAAMPAGSGDPATVYRNLVRFAESGLVQVLSRTGGLDRYVLAGTGGKELPHEHPHFVCRDCGQVSCLPKDLLGPLRTRGAWRRSLQGATIELQGRCPHCLESHGPHAKKH